MTVRQRPGATTTSPACRHRSASTPGWLRSLPARNATLAFLVAILSGLTGCSATIVPPAAPPAPVRILVLDHGQHSSLVLPTEDGAVRYSYGDWTYYAEGHTGVRTGWLALFRPTPAALGRQWLPDPPHPLDTPGALRVEVAAVQELHVDAQRAAALVSELDALFEQAIDTHFYSARLDVHFVHHPVPYTLGHHSNRVVGNWLEELGCTIIGTPLLSNWKIRPTDD